VGPQRHRLLRAPAQTDGGCIRVAHLLLDCLGRLLGVDEGREGEQNDERLMEPQNDHAARWMRWGGLGRGCWVRYRCPGIWVVVVVVKGREQGDEGERDQVSLDPVPPCRDWHWAQPTRDDAAITRRVDLGRASSSQVSLEAPILSQPRRAALQTTRQPALVLIQERQDHGWDWSSWM
jgi:hypothetical protein